MGAIQRAAYRLGRKRGTKDTGTQAAKLLGERGGKVKSARKAAQCRLNGAVPAGPGRRRGRPRIKPLIRTSKSGQYEWDFTTAKRPLS
jgi:hypothetical protein